MTSGSTPVLQACAAYTAWVDFSHRSLCCGIRIHVWKFLQCRQAHLGFVSTIYKTSSRSNSPPRPSGSMPVAVSAAISSTLRSPRSATAAFNAAHCLRAASVALLGGSVDVHGENANMREENTRQHPQKISCGTVKLPGWSSIPDNELERMLPGKHRVDEFT